jgi:hypothetical protein
MDINTYHTGDHSTVRMAAGHPGSQLDRVLKSDLSRKHRFFLELA